MRTVLVTYATEYAGPGAVGALLRSGCQVLCHDPSFASKAKRKAYEAGNPGASALAVREASDLCNKVRARAADIDAAVFNDVYPNSPRPIEEVCLDELRASFEALLVMPFQLSQVLLPVMKARRQGSLVFVTSAREFRPEPGYAVPTAIRATTTAFAKALAQEAAPHQVQVNVVAPNYLASELYYPKARFIDDPQGRAVIEERVPFGRLGEPEEIGELIAFLASGKSPFTTGQVIGFTGGWA